MKVLKRIFVCVFIAIVALLLVACKGPKKITRNENPEIIGNFEIHKITDKDIKAGDKVIIKDKVGNEHTVVVKEKDGALIVKIEAIKNPIEPEIPIDVPTLPGDVEIDPGSGTGIVEYERPIAKRKYEVTLFSDPVDEDPWHKESKATRAFKSRLQKKIIDIEEKYDVRIKFEKYKGNPIEDIEKYVATGSNPAAIARVTTNDVFINLVSSGLLQNIDSICYLDDSEKIQMGKGYEDLRPLLDSAFQLKVGKIADIDEVEKKTYQKQYGISRHKITSMFNMFLYNETIVKEATGEDVMELWKKGQWTWDKLEEMKVKIARYIENNEDLKKPELPRSEGGKPLGFSFQFYLFDILPQKTGTTIDLSNMKSAEVREEIEKFATMWKQKENQTAMWEEMSHNNSDAKTLDDIHYRDSWSEKWRTQNWSPNQHGGSKCFEIGKTAFTVAEPWMYQDMILGAEKDANTRGWKAKLAPVPTLRATKPEDNDFSKITGVSGDILTITKGENYDVATKVMLEINKFWVDENLRSEAKNIKKQFPAKYKDKSMDELIKIAKSGEESAEIWVKTHLLSNNNINETEFNDQVEVLKYYKDPTRLTENVIDKYGVLIPFLDAVHLFMVDGEDLDTGLDKAMAKQKDLRKALLKELKS